MIKFVSVFKFQAQKVEFRDSLFQRTFSNKRDIFEHIIKGSKEVYARKIFRLQVKNTSCIYTEKVKMVLKLNASSSFLLKKDAAKSLTLFIKKVLKREC